MHKLIRPIPHLFHDFHNKKRLLTQTLSACPKTQLPFKRQSLWTIPVISQTTKKVNRSSDACVGRALKDGSFSSVRISPVKARLSVPISRRRFYPFLLQMSRPVSCSQVLSIVYFFPPFVQRHTVFTQK